MLEILFCFMFKFNVLPNLQVLQKALFYVEFNMNLYAVSFIVRLWNLNVNKYCCKVLHLCFASIKPWKSLFFFLFLELKYMLFLRHRCNTFLFHQISQSSPAEDQHLHHRHGPVWTQNMMQLWEMKIEIKSITYKSTMPSAWYFILKNRYKSLCQEISKPGNCQIHI